MKRLLVCSVVLLCGFLNLSVGQGCFEAIIRLDKESLEKIVAAMLANSDMANQLTTLLNQPALSGFLGQIPASSSPSMKCEIEKFPDVKIVKYADDEMGAVVAMIFTITISDVAGVDTVVVDIEKHFTAVIGISEDGFTFKYCSSPPGDGNIEISSPEGLAQSVKETVMKIVKEQVLPVIDQNMCDLVKTALEGPLGDMLSNVFVPPDGTRFTFHNMETDDKYISFLLLVSRKEGTEEERGKCVAPTTTTWKPRCPMKEGALADVTLNSTTIKEHIESTLSKPFPLDPKNPNGETWVPKNFSFVQTAEGIVLNYEPHFPSCEDPNRCLDGPWNIAPSSWNDSVFLVQFLSFQELGAMFRGRCDENTDPAEGGPKDSAEPNDKKQWDCQRGACALIGALGNLKVPVPANVGTAAQLSTNYCESQVVISVHSEMLTK